MKTQTGSHRLMSRSSPINWKRWFVLVFLSVASGFILHQARSALMNRPPSWLQTKTVVGPSLHKGGGWEFPLSRFRSLVNETQQEAQSLRVPLGQVQLYEVRLRWRHPETIVWNLEQFANKGFDPQSRFQHELRISNQQLIGYYTLEGKPIPAVVRQMTNLKGQYPNVEFAVTPPVAPGATLLVIRLARGPKIVDSMQKGTYFLPVGRLPATNTVIASLAVHLPAGATIVRYSPDSGSSAIIDGVPMVSWINSSMQPKDPAPSLRFTLPP